MRNTLMRIRQQQREKEKKIRERGGISTEYLYIDRPCPGSTDNIWLLCIACIHTHSTVCVCVCAMRILVEKVRDSNMRWKTRGTKWDKTPTFHQSDDPNTNNLLPSIRWMGISGYLARNIITANTTINNCIWLRTYRIVLQVDLEFSHSRRERRE